MAFRIYTKTGDDGTTGLFGGARISKDDIRIETYGTIDELNSYIGLIRDQEINESYKSVLFEIQDRLFTIGSILASDPSKNNLSVPELLETDIHFLEKAIDQMDESLPEMKSFVLPGGHTFVSYIHIARCVCRRAERLAVHLSRSSTFDILIIKYLNRLSDYLFTLARKVANDLNATETPWKPRK